MSKKRRIGTGILLVLGATEGATGGLLSAAMSPVNVSNGSVLERTEVPVQLSVELTLSRLADQLAESVSQDELREFGLALTHLGAEAVVPMFTILADGSYQHHVLAKGTKVDSSVQTRGLADQQEVVLLKALAASPVKVLRLHLQQVAEKGLAHSRIAALKVIATGGDTDDFDLAASVASGENCNFPVLDHFTVVYQEFLERDPEFLWSLPNAFDEADDRQRAALLKALPSVPANDVQQVLTAMLDRFGDWKQLLLYGLKEALRRDPMFVADGLAESVARLAEAADTPVALAALDVLYWAADADVAGKLIDQLSHPESARSDRAHRALRHLFELNIENDPEQWTAWENAEVRWAAQHAVGLLSDLRFGQRAQRVQAIRELALHPRENERWSLALEPLLEEAEPDVRSSVCAALGQLAARSSISSLEHIANTDESVEVQQVAKQALKHIYNHFGSNERF